MIFLYNLGYICYQILHIDELRAITAYQSQLIILILLLSFLKLLAMLSQDLNEMLHDLNDKFLNTFFRGFQKHQPKVM